MKVITTLKELINIVDGDARISILDKNSNKVIYEGRFYLLISQKIGNLVKSEVVKIFHKSDRLQIFVRQYTTI